MKRAIIGLVGALAAFLTGCAAFDYPGSMNMSSAAPRQMVACSGGPRSAPVDGARNPSSSGLGAISMASLVDTFHDEPVRSFTLTAQVVDRPGLPQEWTFNGTVPGPEIRVTKGDHVHVTLVNRLPDGVTIHWHGVRIPNAEDGVAGLTQDAVPPGGTYSYDFIAKDAGTFWYHSHEKTFQEVPRGLFGSLVVEDPDSPKPDRDFTVVYHDSQDVSITGFKLVLRILSQRFGRNTRSETEVDGRPAERLVARPGELVRVRIVNAIAGEMPGAPLRLAVIGSDAVLRAIDSHDINEPQPIGKRLLVLGMGQRFDLELRMPAQGGVVIRDPDQTETLTIGDSEEAALGAAALGAGISRWPALDLHTYGTPVAGALGARTRFNATYPLVLGEKPGRRMGTIQLVHTINGKAFPDIPEIRVTEGETVKLHIVNGTNEYHPMHLHGHVFTVLAVDGKPMTGSPIREDSVLVEPHGSADVAFVADNPGLWMFHCHVLLHAAFGMDMMVVYPGIQTPYTVGTDSNNIPE